MSQQQASNLPQDANDGCVGPTAESAGKASACDGCPNQSACASGAMREAAAAPPDPSLQETLSRIKHRVLVLSGKGGVGKSTFAAQLAFGLARRGAKVGLLDVDICGPSVPLMLGLTGSEVHQSASGWSPVYVDVDAENPADDAELAVMSIGFLMPDPDAAVIWRGPRKDALLTQFFTSVDWGYLDYLIVDTPPGTSDEHISMVKLLKPFWSSEGDGAVVVTTPQEVAMTDVRKELSFCKQTGIRVLGIVENMAPMSIPLGAMQFTDSATGKDTTADVLKELEAKCPEVFKTMSARVDVFPRYGGGPEAMAAKYQVPFIGRVPLDRALQRACEDGSPALLAGSAASRPLRDVVSHVLGSTEPEWESIVAARRAEAERAKKQAGGVISVQSANAAR